MIDINRPRFQIRTEKSTVKLRHSHVLIGEALLFNKLSHAIRILELLRTYKSMFMRSSAVASDFVTRNGRCTIFDL